MELIWIYFIIGVGKIQILFIRDLYTLWVEEDNATSTVSLAESILAHSMLVQSQLENEPFDTREKQAMIYFEIVR